MKKLLAVLFLGWFTLSLTMANVAIVPVKVLSAFKTQFPNATDVSWSSEEDVFTVEFWIEDTEMDASYEATGVWLGTNTFLEEIDLPNAIQDYLTEEYAVINVFSIRFTETPKDSNYELLVEIGDEMENEEEGQTEETEEEEETITEEEENEVIKLLFDTDGKIIK